MAYLWNCTIEKKRDKDKKLVTITTHATVHFNDLERSLMADYPDHRWFRLKCKLFGQDGGADQDNVLYVFEQRFYFPGGEPVNVDNPRTLHVTLGEGVLDEDLVGDDEVYARFYLYSYLTESTVNTMDTNTLHLHL